MFVSGYPYLQLTFMTHTGTDTPSNSHRGPKGFVGVWYKSDFPKPTPNSSSSTTHWVYEIINK